MNPLNIKRIKSLLWISFALLFLGLFLKLSWELHEDALVGSIDRAILTFTSHFRSEKLNRFSIDLSALGSPTVLTFISVLTTLLLYRKNNQRASLYLAIGSIGAAIATPLMKHFFTRERPTTIPHLIDVEGYSYPSGHSLGAASIYLLLLFISWQYYRSWQDRIMLSAFATILISGIALSRLYLGVHYPSDVLSGIFFGTAWICMLTYSFKLNCS